MSGTMLVVSRLDWPHQLGILASYVNPAGLPRILVDIRHEASHNELPSLALLRLGATSALAWLSQSYWQQQADHLTLRKSQIKELLQV